MEKKENGSTPLLEGNNTTIATSKNGTAKIVKTPTKSKTASNSQLQDSHEVR